MKNGKQPINPIIRANGFEATQVGQNELSGLTKREYFAGLALQGLCANSIAGPHHEPKNLVKEAIQYADELLKQLEKTQ